MKKTLSLLFAASLLFLTAFAKPVRDDLAGRLAGFDGKSPTAYIVEYLESTGEQYIVVDGFQDGIDIVLSHLASTPYYLFVGAWNGGSRMQGINYMTFRNRGYTFNSISGAGLYTEIMDNATPKRIVVDGTDAFVGGDSFQLPAPWTYNSSLMPDKFALFGGIAPTLKVSPVLGRIYSCKLYRSGAMTHDLVAIRFLNEAGEWEGALYDFVEETIYRNLGTGSFLYGPDIEEFNP